jgi:long-subunit acyl-CoA synthetase (AMP-forming)
MTEICWILEFVRPEIVLVDREVAELVSEYKCKRIIVDDDVDGKSGEYEDAVTRGRYIDLERGDKGWDDLVIDDVEETDTMVLNCTSGTTSNPKVLLSRVLTTVCRNNLSGDISRSHGQHN